MLIKQNQLVINGTTLEQSDLQAIANVASDVQAQIDTKAPINNAQFTGNVGIGTDSPAALLHINGSGDAVRVTSTNSGSGGAQVDLIQYTTSPADNDIHGMINFGGYTSGTSAAYGSSIRSVWSDVSAKEGQLQFFTRDDADFSARMVIDKDGRVGIGTSAPMSHLHVNKDTTGHNTDGITLGKVEANGWIDTNEEMGRLSWAASYGSSYTSGIGAYISAKADANWDGTETPTRLGFFTAPENSTTPVERMRISKDGSISNYNNQPAVQPTLTLDFINTDRIDSNIMFSRDTVATYYGEDGFIKYARINEPRIEYNPVTRERMGFLCEEASSNIFVNTNSPEFWSLHSGGSSAAQRPNELISPDGTMNASRLFVTGSDPYWYQNNLTLNGTYTFSYYIKAIGNTIGKSYTDRVTNTNGVGSGIVTKYLTGDWVRHSRTFTTSSVSTAYIGIEAPDASPALLDQVSIWGAQLEKKSWATSYMPSVDKFVSRSSAATYYDKDGVLRTAPANSPRYGYNYNAETEEWLPTGLIREEASTNLLYQNGVCTDTFGDALGAEAKWTMFDNNSDVIAPDGSQFTTKGATGGSGNHWFWMVSPGSRTNGQRYTHSVWIRSAAGTTATIQFNCYPQSGQVDVTATDEWQRVEVSYTHNSSLGNAYIGFVSPESNKTFYFWGWQIEAGYRATSYISGINSATVRSADVSVSNRGIRKRDVAEIHNLEPWYNENESTIFGEGTSITGEATVGSSPCLWGITDGFSGNRYIIRRYGTPTNTANSGFTLRFCQTPPSGLKNNDYFPASSVGLGSWNDDSIHKMSLAIEPGSQTGSVDGLDAQMPSVTDTIPYKTANRVEIGFAGSSTSWNGHIRKLVYYPKKLSIDEQKALTEIS